MFVSAFAVFAVVYLPEKFSTDTFTQESGHTYNSWIVNMCREGLDKSKYPWEMEAIDKYISLEAIDYINKELGDENYRDEYIAWREGYVGIRKDASEEDYLNYVKAVQGLVIREPWVFIKTRIGVWNYMTRVNKSFKDMLPSLSGNLNIPLLAILATIIYGGIKRKWLSFFLAGMIASHGLVTLLFAPAAYEKYFYHLYLFGWVLIFRAAINLCDRLKNQWIIVREHKIGGH